MKKLQKRSNEPMKKLLFPDKSNILNTALLSAYLLVVNAATIFVHLNRIPFWWAILLAVTLVLIPCLSTMLSWLEGLSLSGKSDKESQRRAFLYGAVASFVVLMLWFFGNYPGLFCEDNKTQFYNVLTHVYDDWHPVWHTLLFFWLPYKLMGTIQYVVLIQLIYISLAMGMLIRFVYSRCGSVWAFLTWSYVILNPYFAVFCLTATKDMGFAAAVIVCAMMAFEFTDGTRAWNVKNCLVFSFFLICATLFRHNGILFTGFLLFGLLFNLERKQWIALMLAFCAMFGLIKGPLYGYLGVKKPDGRVTETVGLPMTVIGNCVQNCPEKLDGEILEFAYRVAPKETWENDFVTGNYNNMKFGDTTDNRVIDQAGAMTVLRYMFRCFRLAPTESWESVIRLTKNVYGIVSRLSGPAVLSESDMSFGTHELKVQWLRDLEIRFCGWMLQTKIQMVFNYGIPLFASLLCVFAKCNLFCAAGWKKLTMCLSIYAYSFGTMLLLTGFDTRLHCSIYLVCPMLMAATLGSRGETT